jgi:CRISPR/Cas system CSM-associated protein Csm2 small subunit
MSLQNGYDIAQRLQIQESELNDLLDGKVNYSTAQKFKLHETDMQYFFDGNVSYDVAKKFNMRESELQELVTHLGKKGVIGVFIGLLLSQE